MKFAAKWCRSLQMTAVGAVILALSGFLPGLAEQRCHARGFGERDYLAELNAPILEITPKNKSYETYFNAWVKLDLGDSRAPISRDALQFGSTTLADAVAWVSEPSQRAALDLLLDSDGANPNVTFRRVLGLPYGTRDIPTDMDSNGFAVYINGDLISETDFAYLPLYGQIELTLMANAQYEVSRGNTSAAVNSLIACLRMGRQLCDRAYRTEMEMGMTHVIETMLEIRTFLWNYRDTLAVDDMKKIAEELELLGLGGIKPPRAHELVGEQITEKIFGKDLRPDREVFAQMMARFESREHPLDRFSATAKWRDLMTQHATYNETVAELEAVAGDIRLRWRFAFNDPSFDRLPEIRKISPLKYAIPRAVFKGIEDIFPLRHVMISHQHGIICAAGVAAYQKNEGGKLVPGERAEFAPIALKQIQPAFILSEEMLQDPQDAERGRYHYLVVTNREKIRTNILKDFTINTQYGSVRLIEGWPILYSIGWDGDDDEAKTHTDSRDGDGDFIYWPVVEVMARER